MRRQTDPFAVSRLPSSLSGIRSRFLRALLITIICALLIVLLGMWIHGLWIHSCYGFRRDAQGKRREEENVALQAMAREGDQLAGRDHPHQGDTDVPSGRNKRAGDAASTASSVTLS